MLLARSTLDGIAAGSIKVVYRRWTRPRVKVGTELRTAIGVLRVDAIARVALSNIKTADALQAGYGSRAELVAELKAREGSTYRIEVTPAGKDPRLALRSRPVRTHAERDELAAALERMDRASKNGPWTRRYLELIGDQSGRRAGDLAEVVGADKVSFKRRVRRLKELGLSESLQVGYRLSPRGASFLKRLKCAG